MIGENGLEDKDQGSKRARADDGDVDELLPPSRWGILPGKKLRGEEDGEAEDSKG
jgi:hypothetical protein